LSLEDVDGAEMVLFDAVIGQEGVSDSVLGNLALAAADADHADETPNENLFSLAERIASAVTRRTVLDRLNAALCHLDHAGAICNDRSSGGCDTIDPPRSVSPFTDRVSCVARARVTLSKLSMAPQHALSSRLDTILQGAGEGNLRLCCYLLLEGRSSTLTASQHVANSVQQRFLNMRNSEAAAKLWSSDAELLAQVSEADFALFRQYLAHLLARLSCCLWRHLVDDAEALDATDAALREMENACPSGELGRLRRDALRDQCQSACADLKELAGVCDTERPIEEVAGDVTFRLLSISSRCGCVRSTHPSCCDLSDSPLPKFVLTRTALPFTYAFEIAALLVLSLACFSSALLRDFPSYLPVSLKFASRGCLIKYKADSHLWKKNSSRHVRHE
jgi:hypothetical protein